MAQQKIDGELYVTSNIDVGPIDFEPNIGKIRVTGEKGSLQLYRRNLTTAPKTWAKGDAFDLYNPNGAFRLWTPVTGDLLTVTADGNVGIGTTTPQAKLQVTGGAITPEVGNNDQAGILFPKDPGGGSGDKAYIRYYVEGTTSANTSEKTKLLIGIENDSDDSIGLFQSGAERLTVTNGNVGIGTQKPEAKLQVSGLAAFDAAAGIDFHGPSWSLSNGSQKSKFIRWGYNRPNAVGGDVITVYVPGNNDNSWEAINIFSAYKRVGINTANPDQTLSIDGNASKTGGGTFAALSDARTKTNVMPYQRGLELIKQLSPVKFRYKPEFDAKGSDAGREYVGFVAQELQKVCPSMVLETQRHNESSSLLMTDISELTFTLVNAIKDLSDKVSALEARLNAA
ncbi:tail fiber domain-containing protein [Scytonema sp. PCC 10023]|uniref:tail fiber domain-containing protein n=1 Tax=Scytonema sp. PCC 10023 TaxID=1680591 RepID=UPI0039C6728D